MPEAARNNHNSLRSYVWQQKQMEFLLWSVVFKLGCPHWDNHVPGTRIYAISNPEMQFQATKALTLNYQIKIKTEQASPYTSAGPHLTATSYSSLTI